MSASSMKPAVDLCAINPLIDASGDTFPVQSVISLVSHMLVSLSDDEGAFNLPSGHAFGMALLLDTCAAALRFQADPKCAEMAENAAGPQGRTPDTLKGCAR